MDGHQSINTGVVPCSRVGREFYNNTHYTGGKLIALMVGKGVSVKVASFRETNRKAHKGLSQMEWNVFRLLHGI